ncbi:MAG: TonB-dependent receptor [Ignavibacteria bacterium]|nr:TonB-dependent receptor [Ignavibacteria bacterium]
MIFHVTLLISFLLFSFPLSSQTSTDIRGTIKDQSGKPLVGVSIFIKELDRGTQSKSGGNFILTNVPYGSHQLEARLLGYEALKLPITLSSGSKKEFSFTLKQSTVLLKEVDITASRRKQEQTDTRPSILTIEPKEAKFKAGAAEDVLRSLQTLPGVVAPNDFSSQLVIRGSGPDQNLIVMDNIEVFNPYRLYGFVSMFNPETVSGITLLTGGFPAKYSDRLSAVLDITNREGTTERSFAGKTNISLTNANLVLEGGLPFWDASWIVSTRRTYYDLIAGPIARASGAVDGDIALPNFRDIQAKLVFKPFTNHTFIINGISSRDNTELTSGTNRTQADSISLFDKSFNDVVGFTWLWSPNDKMITTSTISYYNNIGSSNFGGEGGSNQIFGDTSTRESIQKIQDSLRNAGIEVPTLYSIEGSQSFNFEKTSFKSELGWKLSPEHYIELGGAIDFISTGVDFEIVLDPRLKALRASNPRIAAFPESFGTSIDYARSSLYIQDNYKITKQLTLTPGLRLDRFEIIGQTYLSPRFSASYAIDSLTTIRGAWGLYYQSPGYEKLFDRQVFLDLTTSATQSLLAEKATHYIAGIERMLTPEWQIRVEGYYKDFDDLILQQKLRGTNYRTERIDGKDITKREGWTSPIAFEGDSLTATPVNNATGNAFGVEVFLQKLQGVGDSPFYGWLSYSFGFANRYRDGFTIPFNFDRRHNLSITGGWKAASWLDVNFTWAFGTGFPWTKPVGIKPRIIQQKDTLTGNNIAKIDEDWRGVVFIIDRGGDENLNQTRLPDYHRLDIRGTTYAQWFGWEWSFYLDIINVYNRKNILAENYRVNRQTLEIETRQTAMLPILPTIGISVKF